MKYFVYILQTVDDTYYCGVAIDVEKRFQEHSEGIGAKYTRAHKPLKIVYKAEFNDRSAAQKEECRIKRLTKQEKNELISGFKGIQDDLEGH